MKYIKNGFILFLSVLLVNCSDWTTTTLDNPTDLVNSARTETYYANLRAYKQRLHPIVYGKINGWTGTGSILKGQLIGLPDSLDIIGIIKDTLVFTPEMLQDMQKVQSKKATKIVLSVGITNVGDALPVGTIVNSVKEYAEALVNVVKLCGFDGIDIELCPQTNGLGTIAGNEENTQVFVQTLAKSLGPQSTEKKLLLLSGEVDAVAATDINKFNYLISYSFGVKTDSELDRKLVALSEEFSSVYSLEEMAKKVIFMEDFQTNSNGGVPFTDRFNNSFFSLEGIARWLPLYNGKYINKAGIGVYRMENEYTMDGFDSTFPYVHQAIQILNPSIK